MSQSTTFVLVLGGLVLGAGVGYALHAAVATPEKETEVVVEKEELTEEEILALCGDQMKDERESLQDAQAAVVDLQSKLEAQEQELTEFRERAKKGAAAAKETKAKIAELEAEVERLSVALEEAEQERDELLVELKDTVKKLESQIKETEKQRQRAEKYKDESQQNLWTTFMAEAKVAICDRGTRKRHAKCHEAVENAINPVKGQFVDCVDTYQSTPLLVQGEKGQELPIHAEWVNEDDRFTKKGWYIQYCDPTLPEANVGDDPG